MIRITAGLWKGREIRTPHERHAKLGVRPTLAKTRQALWNALQLLVPEGRVLDLFAGSGALGLEALSRAAAVCVFVEKAKPSLECLKHNIEAFECQESAKILRGDVFLLADEIVRGGPYDVVVADPPYEMGFETRLLNELSWERVLAGPDARLVIEWYQAKGVPQLPDACGALVKERDREYGHTVLTTYRLREA